MSTFPRIESRVSALERRQNVLDAHIEEISEDMITAMKELSRDMTAGFKQMVTYVTAIEDRFEKIEGDVATIKTTMATKEEMTAMESRILDAFKQLLTMLNQPHSPLSE